MGERATFLDEHHLQLGGFDFYCAFPLSDPPFGYLQVEKTRDLVERYIALVEELRPARIVELGIRRGGSTALLSELARPDKLVSVEIEAAAPAGLTRYLERSGRGESVRPYFGVDQADRDRLGAIIDDEFCGKPLDLVIDDASHYYEQTLASFEVLFPHVRPGGLFIIEDWQWEHRMGDRVVAALRAGTPERRAEATKAIERAMASGERQPPLTRLVIALLLVCASSNDAVLEITAGPYWVMVRRGPAALDPIAFRVADRVNDHFGLL